MGLFVVDLGPASLVNEEYRTLVAGEPPAPEGEVEIIPAELNAHSTWYSGVVIDEEACRISGRAEDLGHWSSLVVEQSDGNKVEVLISDALAVIDRAGLNTTALDVRDRARKQIRMLRADLAAARLDNVILQEAHKLVRDAYLDRDARLRAEALAAPAPLKAPRSSTVSHTGRPSPSDAALPWRTCTKDEALASPRASQVTWGARRVWQRLDQALAKVGEGRPEAEFRTLVPAPVATPKPSPVACTRDEAAANVKESEWQGPSRRGWRECAGYEPLWSDFAYHTTATLPPHVEISQPVAHKLGALKGVDVQMLSERTHWLPNMRGDSPGFRYRVLRSQVPEGFILG
jgi:hypothetical protein